MLRCQSKHAIMCRMKEWGKQKFLARWKTNEIGFCHQLQIYFILGILHKQPSVMETNCSGKHNSCLPRAKYLTLAESNPHEVYLPTQSAGFRHSSGLVEMTFTKICLCFVISLQITRGAQQLSEEDIFVLPVWEYICLLISLPACLSACMSV